jgi:SNF2 family DNA or RNA helicase
MDIDSVTYIIYDKFAQESHSYNNKLTSDITIDKLFKSDAEVIDGDKAIQEFNNYALKTHKIKDKIDTKFYKVHLFKLKENNLIKKILIIGIDKKELDRIFPNIPQKDFLIEGCSNHISYCKKNSNIIKQSYDMKKDNIIKNAGIANADITDPIIENPEFTQINLFDYQRRTIKWMLEKEKSSPTIYYNFNDQIMFGKYVCDLVKKDIFKLDEQKKIVFSGGLLCDEVGLGKTFQMLTLSLLNQAGKLSYFNDNLKRLQSRATLVMCPNQLCNQWIREITKTINKDYPVKILPILTKVHFDKYSYSDVLNADFVIVSYTFLGNDVYYKKWLETEMGKTKATTYINNSFTEDTINNIIENNYKKFKTNPALLFEKGVVLNFINFHRIITDEFHETQTLTKYNYLKKMLPLFSGTYKWCVTGTPFDKGDCFTSIFDFVTQYKIINDKRIIENDNIYNYLSKSFFRRNTKQSVKNEYQLIPYDEKILYLKFSPTERAIYNAYLADPNIRKFSKLVRQLCCDPRIADEIKSTLSTCTTLEDIEKKMVQHYKKVADAAQFKVQLTKYKISKLERRIKVTEYKRQRKFLKQIGYRVMIDFPPKIFEQIYEKEIDEENKNLDIEDDDPETNDEKQDMTKTLMTINEENQTIIINKIKNLLDANPSRTLNELKIYRQEYDNKLREVTNDANGKKGTCEFFTNMMAKLNKINKIHQDKIKSEKLDEDSDEDSDEEDDDTDTCPICLGEITGADLGVIPCGHIFCHACIKDIIVKNPKCPVCRKPSTMNQVMLISYEKPKLDNINSEIKDKISLINKVGTKLANLILYIKSCNEKCIVFSQWDDLLVKVGTTLDTYGIKNVFCRGNVWVRDKAIRDFTFNDDIRVIMLSSESAASGTNLTAATQVILLDPVYKDDDYSNIGNYEYRRNTEWQAIGRAYRMGQTKKVTVVRLIIKDSIEEEIYKANIEEDNKYKLSKDFMDKMIELTDDKIIATNDQLSEIANAAKSNSTKKGRKTKVQEKVIDDIQEDLIEDEDLE